MPGKEKSTQQTVSQPWAPAQSALKGQIAGAEAWRDSPGASQAYSGDRVADMSSQTQQGIDTLTGGQGTQQTQDYLSRIIGGDYLNQGNPYQADLDNSIRSAVAPSINATFSNAGMTGSTTHQGILQKGLTEGLAAPRYQNYQNERAMQMQAAGMLPGVENGRATQLLTAGQTREGYDQREIEAAREAFEEQRTAGLRPYLETQPIFGQIGGMGGTQTSTQTKQPSLGQTITGAGLMGASLLAPWAAGPAGAAGSAFSSAGGNVNGTAAPYGTFPWQK